jgi:uncharacterized protein (TIGR03067 family)
MEVGRYVDRCGVYVTRGLQRNLRLAVHRFQLAFSQYRNPILVTMKRKLLVITGLGLLLLACNRQQQPAAAPKTDLDRFQGTWYLIAAVKDGNVLPEDKVKQTTIVFKGDTFRFPGSAEYATSKEGTIKLDENKTPKEIDAISTEKEVMLGIYRMDDNGYKVCFAPAGKPRPTEIRSEPGSGNILQSWGREPKS